MHMVGEELCGEAEWGAPRWLSPNIRGQEDYSPYEGISHELLLFPGLKQKIYMKLFVISHLDGCLSNISKLQGFF